MGKTDPFSKLDPCDKQRLFALGTAQIRGETTETGVCLLLPLDDAAVTPTTPAHQPPF